MERTEVGTKDGRERVLVQSGIRIHASPAHQRRVCCRSDKGLECVDAQSLCLLEWASACAWNVSFMSIDTDAFRAPSDFEESASKKAEDALWNIPQVVGVPESILPEGDLLQTLINLMLICLSFWHGSSCKVHETC